MKDWIYLYKNQYWNIFHINQFPYPYMLNTSNEFQRLVPYHNRRTNLFIFFELSQNNNKSKK